MEQSAVSASSRKRIIVVGAGIAGLAAAHRVVELAGRDGVGVDVLLLEARGRLGGNIVTQKRDGFLIEGGPDSFITQKPWGLALAKRLGIESELIPTNPACRRTFVVRNGRMHAVPEGFLLLAPTRIWPFVFSRLFSWPAKIRMGMDLFIPAKDHGAEGDESLSSFVTRRFGREALERVAQPLVSGIYTADPTDLSLRATMPRFLEMENKYGSIIKAMRRERKAAARKAGETPAPPGGRADSGARYSMFVSFAKGMSTLVDALAARLPAGAMRLNAAVSRVERVGVGEGAAEIQTARTPPKPPLSKGGRDGGQDGGDPRTPPKPPLAKGGKDGGRDARPPGWRVVLEGGGSEYADGVVLACPAYTSAELVRDVDARLAEELAGIRYASSATMSLAFRREDVPHPLDGFGFVVPVVETRTLIAATFSNVKFPGRAPEGWVLMRAFLGGAMHAHVFEMDDETLREAVLRDLREIVGVRGMPAFVELYRWPKSMPQYPVGHLERVKRIDGRLAELPGLAVAGNAFGGVGIPDCVHSGEMAAERVLGAVHNLTVPAARCS